jgi:hypothetical protein
MEPFRLPIDKIQFSQLYISSEKLTAVMKVFENGKEDDLEPIPIKELDGSLVSTDGHTRILAWYLHGYTEVECVWEDIEMDWDAYRICVQWCKDEGVEHVDDLNQRIIGPEDYQVLWLDRCRLMQEQLNEDRTLQSL